MSSDQDPIIPPIPSIPPSPAQEVSRGVATASPISDLSYRSYEGPLKTRYSRWWVVAHAGLRQSFSQPLLYVLFGLPLLRFLIAGFQIYFLTNLIPNGQNIPNFPGEPEGQKFANLFWSAMCGDFNALLMMVIAVAIGAGAIAADNRSNALLVYLAKPIGKTDYLIGKWLNLFLTIFICEAVPIFLLYLFCAFSYRDSGFFKDEPWLGPRLLLGLFIPATIHASVLIGLSAWSKSPRIVGAVYASFYIISGIVAGVVSRILYPDNQEMKNLFSHFCLRGVINGLQQNNLHVTISHAAMRRGGGGDISAPPQLAPLLIIAGVLVIGGLLAARAKINAVEVIRG